MRNSGDEWNSIEETCVAKFAEAALSSMNEVTSIFGERSEKEAVKRCLHVDDDEAQSILDDLDVDSLRCDVDLKAENKLLLPKGCQLSTLKHLNEALKHSPMCRLHRVGADRKWSNQSSSQVSNVEVDVATTCAPVEFVEPENDVMLTLIFFRPLNKPFGKKYLPRWRNSYFDFTVQVLGGQTLDELRDCIDCPSDKAPLVEVNADSDLDGLPTAGHLYRGAFFYIDETFYNDLRSSEATDLSEPVRDWLTRIHGGRPSFRMAKMEDTRFNELKFRFGQPYVYVHQGHCEHLLIFSDIRLVHRSDPQNRSLYPLRMVRSAMHFVRCDICKLRFVKWNVECAVGDSPFRYNFLCNECLHCFCYDEEGKRIRDFVLTPFYSRCSQ